MCLHARREGESVDIDSIEARHELTRLEPDGGAQQKQGRRPPKPEERVPVRAMQTPQASCIEAMVVDQGKFTSGEVCGSADLGNGELHQGVLLL